MPTPIKELPWGKERVPLQDVRDRVLELAKATGLPAATVPWKNSWANNPRYVSKRLLRINDHLTAVYSVQRKAKHRRRWYAEATISQQSAGLSSMIVYHVRVPDEPERIYITPRKEVERSYASHVHIPLDHANITSSFPWHRFENQWNLFATPPAI